MSNDLNDFFSRIEDASVRDALPRLFGNINSKIFASNNTMFDGMFEGVVCAAACACVCVIRAQYIARGQPELVGEDGALAAALAARRAGGAAAEGSVLRGWRPSADPYELSEPDDGEEEALPPAELARMEAALRRGTRRRQGENFTHEADEFTIVYKSVQLMFHAYYASQSRLEALRTVVQDIEGDDLFVMAFAFKKMDTWLAAAKSMYYQVVTEHNREVARPIGQRYDPYEKYGANAKKLGFFTNLLSYIINVGGREEAVEPPYLKWPEFLPYTFDNNTVAHIMHPELLVWRNYTLAVHLMVDVSYTCEFMQYLNHRLRKAFKLDEDDSPIN